MNTLRQQFNPHMTMVPGADETFGQYVRELIASSKGFTGPFAGLDQPREQATTPQTSITEGLFKDLLPEAFRDREGRGDGNIGAGRDTSRDGMGQGINLGLQSLGASLEGSPKTAAFAANQVLGMLGLGGIPSLIGTPLAKAAGQGIRNSQADREGMRSIALQNFSAVPGIRTISDVNGNVLGISNDNSIAMSDAAMFGTPAPAPAPAPAPTTVSSAAVGGGRTGGTAWGGYSSPAAQSAAQSRQAAESRAVAASLSRTGGGSTAGRASGFGSNAGSAPGGRSTGGGYGAGGW